MPPNACDRVVGAYYADSNGRVFVGSKNNVGPPSFGRCLAKSDRVRCPV